MIEKRLERFKALTDEQMLKLLQSKVDKERFEQEIKGKAGKGSFDLLKEKVVGYR